MAPGEQLPAHAPLVHTNWQAVPFCHSPAEVQVRGTVPLQLSEPGVQTPEQVPCPLQTNGQAVPLIHAPSALHIWGIPVGLH